MFLLKDIGMKPEKKLSADRPIIIFADGIMDRILSPNLKENMKQAKIKHMTSEHVAYFTYYMFVIN